MNQTIEILILAGLAISGAGYLITEIIWLRKRAKSEEEKRSGRHEEKGDNLDEGQPGDRGQ